MATGVGGPVGAMMLSAGVDGIIQKATTGEVNWTRVAVAGAAGLVGGGLGAAAAGKVAGSCLTKAVTAGAVDGAVSAGMMYFTEPGPHNVGGFFGSVAMGVAGGGIFAGAGHALGKVTGWVKNACFTADTQVLMADSTSKSIQDIVVGEVEAVFIHHNVATWRVTTDDGHIDTTAAHPFYVEGTGWTPAEELRPRDQLHTNTGKTNTIVEVVPTGNTATIYNFTVTALHNYHVATNSGTWVLVHNSCELPEYLSTGRYAEPGHSVYAGIVGEAHEYVGRTNDLVRRTAEHFRAGRNFLTSLVPGAGDLTLWEARAVEQAVIHHMNPSQNLQRSIAESREFYGAL